MFKTTAWALKFPRRGRPDQGTVCRCIILVGFANLRRGVPHVSFSPLFVALPNMETQICQNVNVCNVHKHAKRQPQNEGKDATKCLAPKKMKTESECGSVISQETGKDGEVGGRGAPVK
jgi:hypothetical protein